jgi:hypothetical protein
MNIAHIITYLPHAVNAAAGGTDGGGGGDGGVDDGDS